MLIKYLGLTWKDHVRKKRVSLNSRLKVIYRLVRYASPMSLRLKLLMYKMLLRPIWSYGAVLFGSAKISHISKLQAFQSKFLRLVTGSPLYVSNRTLHDDLQMPYVTDYIKFLHTKYYDKLQNHQNPLVSILHRRDVPRLRRLRRSWNRDLLD